MNVEDLQQPNQWAGRVALFFAFPVLAAFMLLGVVLFLVVAWPTCLFLHKLPTKNTGVMP